MSSLFLNIYVRTSASTPIIAAFSGVLWDRRAFGTNRRLQHPSVRLDEVLICSVLGGCTRRVSCERPHMRATILVAELS